MTIEIKKRLKYTTLTLLLGLSSLFCVQEAFCETKTNVQQASQKAVNNQSHFTKGISYLLGNGEEADDQQAIHYLTLAAQNNHIQAQVILGALLAYESDAQDLSSAKKWYESASKAGNAQATLELSKMAESGLLQERDEKQAKELEAIAKKQIESNMLYQIQLELKKAKNPYVLDINETPDNILKKIKAKAEQDDAVSQWALAELIRIGFSNTKVNLDESSDYMKKAAEGGFARAQAAYAGMFFSGEGVEKDKPSGQFWLNKALEKKEPHALMMMAMEYKASGKRNDAATKLYEAFSLGDNEVKQMIGLLYAWGNGVILNESEKMTEVRRFAQRGECEAMMMQGLMYSQGWETKQYESKALEVYEKAQNKMCRDILIPKSLLLAKTNQVNLAKELLDQAQKNKDFNFVYEKEMLRRIFLCLPLIDVNNVSTEKDTKKEVNVNSATCSQKIKPMIDFLNQAALENNISAQLLLSQLYRYGFGVEKNEVSAKSYRDKACMVLKKQKDEDNYEKFCGNEEVENTLHKPQEKKNENDGKERFSFKIST